MRNFEADARREKTIHPKDWFRKNLLGIWSIEPGLIRSKYFEWSKGWGLAFDFSKHRYSDDTEKSSMLHVQCIYGHWFIYLPLGLKVKDYYDTVEPPQYGFSWRWEKSLGGVHCHWNRKVKIIEMPWSSSTHKYEYLGVDGNWYPVLSKETHPERYSEIHDYAHYSSGLRKLQEAKATVTRTRHDIRWTWFGHYNSPVSDFLRKYQFFGKSEVNSIDVEFDREMGNREGSWKGGTIGCGYNMKPGESMVGCLRRMEKERSFDR